MDQSALRLQEMPYTLENIEEEVLNRYAVIKRGPVRNDAGESTATERSGSNGPGGNPFTMDRLGEDVLQKLKHTSDRPVEELLAEFESRLKANTKLKADETAEIMAALRAAALLPATPAAP